MQSEYRVYIGYLPKELIPQRLLKAKTNYWNSRHVKIPKLFNLRFPIAPESIEMKSSSGNKTITLINGGQVNILKSPELTEWTMDMRLPDLPGDPAAVYSFDLFLEPYVYIDLAEALKTRKTVFKLMIQRDASDGKEFYTSTLASLEDYTLKEDASAAYRFTLSMTFKKYVPYGTRKITVKKSGKKKKVSKKKKSREHIVELGHRSTRVKKGDTLPKLSKKHYGSTKYWKALYKYNKLVIEKAAKKHKRKSSVYGKYLYAGTVLFLPNKSVIKKTKA